ncbi:hypothetical protein CWB96_04180 [Pseudoalteromonas citrea]|uniref:Aminoglycoside phosphotransferase domain-containing protein n=1 Tax=Pseudoalteromonas citrea TaxID=43655 RepID=A0A5S3XU01_9GAMM|nr:phosphotransferase [Pseudoalteromonas citrea]TMP45130.1 hypothetical protein CWB97_04830 [Pseudoalteromonas citrea]TMP61489.1 hypothetical protein CWB96_04180 [Pseudoalteromonas citrea]
MTNLAADLTALAQALLPTLHVERIERLARGLSNDNFLLQTNQGKLLLKCYKGKVPVPFLNIQNALADMGITQSVRAYDCDKRIALFEFIEEVAPFTALDVSLIQCLVTLHEYQGLDNTVPVDIISFVKKLTLKELECAEHHMLQAVKLIESLPRDLAFCHNDLVFDNLLNADHGPRLIDFEYAQYNDVYFDLAALSCSFNLDTQAQNALLKTYYAHRHLTLPDYAIGKLLAYQIVYLLLSIEWYQSRGAYSYARPLIARLHSLVD